MRTDLDRLLWIGEVKNLQTFTGHTGVTPHERNIIGERQGDACRPGWVPEFLDINDLEGRHF